MATIKINNLKSNGSDLFNDSENYLNELTNGEDMMTNGGITPIIAISVETVFISLATYSFP